MLFVAPPDCINTVFYSDALAVARPGDTFVGPAEFVGNLRRQKRLAGDWPGATVLFAFDFENYAVPLSLMEAAWERGVTPWLILYPYGGLGPILRGEADDYLRAAALVLALWTRRRPLVLQFGTEVNLDYYPWAAVHNGGFGLVDTPEGPWPKGPADYRVCHRRVHDLFTAAGVDASWHFHGFLEWQHREHNHLEWYYPGAAYTTSVGVGFMFEPGNSTYGTFAGGYAASLAELRRVTGRYGLAQPEYLEIATTDDPDDPEAKAEYYRDLFDYDYSLHHAHGLTLGFWDSVTAAAHAGPAAPGTPNPVPKYAPAVGRQLPGSAAMAIDTTRESEDAFCYGVRQPWFTGRGRQA